MVWFDISIIYKSFLGGGYRLHILLYLSDFVPILQMFKGNERHGKIVWGAIGFGTLKLAVHKACIQKLFESNNQLLDAEEIFDIAKSMA